MRTARNLLTGHYDIQYQMFKKVKIVLESVTILIKPRP